MAQRYPNLVQFGESAVRRDYVAFARRKDISIAGWGTLEPYTVGIITGWKILERNIKGTKSLTKVKTADQLFSLLEAGRADLVVYSRLSGLQLIKDRGLKGIRVVEPPLADRDTYFYLHKKHENLVAQADAALRQMKADGSYQRLYDRTIGSLVSD